jgi:hypothetical protein
MIVAIWAIEGKGEEERSEVEDKSGGGSTRM